MGNKNHFLLIVQYFFGLNLNWVLPYLRFITSFKHFGYYMTFLSLHCWILWIIEYTNELLVN